MNVATPPPAELAVQILAPLARLRVRARALAALDGLVRLAASMVVCGAAQFVLDFSLRMAVDQRATINVIITLIWLWIIHRWIIRPVAAPLPDAALAAAVDRAHPHLQDRLATAVQFAAGGRDVPGSNSPALVRAVIDDACQAARQTRFADVLNVRRARGSAATLGVLVAASALAWSVQPGLMNTWFQRNWLVRELPWPQRTYLSPIGFDAAGVRRAPRGEELRLEATIEGDAPNAVVLRWWTPSGRAGREVMTVIGNRRAEATLAALTEPLSFQISGGDERTRDFAVVPVDRPRVERSVATIRPPDYTRIGETTIEQQAVLEVLAGSIVRIDAEFNKPVHTASLTDDAEVELPIERPSADRVRVQLPDPQPGVYMLRMTDFDGLSESQPFRYTLRVLPDAPPTLSLDTPGAGEAITPQAQLPISVSADDAYGIASLRMRVQRRDDPPFEPVLNGFTPGDRQHRLSTTLDVQTQRVEPGERLRLWLEADDAAPTPNSARTDAIEFAVLTPADLREALGERELELRREFERIISEQRRVKDGLERAAPLLIGETPDAAAPARVAGLARLQEAQAGRCTTIARGFEDILVEMQINRLARAADERRLWTRIALPLRRMAQESMPAAETEIASLRAAREPDALAEALRRQDGLLGEMDDILRNMLESEGFREAVALLQEMIGEQRQVREDTLRAIESELEAILGLETEPAEPDVSGDRP